MEGRKGGGGMDEVSGGERRKGRGRMELGDEWRGGRGMEVEGEDRTYRAAQEAG